MTSTLNMIVKGCALSFLLILCAGCASTKIESAKAEGYGKMPTRVLVFLPLGPTASTVINGQTVFSNPAEGKLDDGFDEVFLKFMSNCNIASQTNNEDLKKSGNLQTPAVLLASYNPDWLITVVPTQKQTSQRTLYGAPIGSPTTVGITYNVTVTDQKENQKIWRANVNVSLVHSTLFSGDDLPGRNTATAIIEQMRADGLLTSCPVLQN